jgi:hypothetical protein
MLNRHRRFLTIVTLLLLCVMFVGCGGGDAPQPQSTVAAPQATESSGNGSNTPQFGQPTATTANKPPSGGGLDLATLDVCGLLPEEDVKAVVGSDTYETEAYPPEDGPGCHFGADQLLMGFTSISLELYPPGEWDRLKKPMIPDEELEEAHSALIKSVEPVAGIGDEAILQIYLLGAHEMIVLVEGRAAFLLQVTPGAKEGASEPDFELGRQSVLRLAPKVVERLRR